jgi:hypothetical protein
MPAIRTTRDTASRWREERNKRALARLMKALPAVFPAPVLGRAVSRPFVPPMPRLAVDGYWRAHPLRADRLARALAARSGAPAGWCWRIGEESGLPQSFRVPPAPYREARYALGKAHCCVCGQKVYRFGWHADLWGSGPNRNAEWHSACVVAWRFWNSPSDQAQLLKRLQRRRCAQSGARLWRSAEVDHKVPLFEVWRERREMPWPHLLGFWGVPNLQVINRDVHVQKCAAEAQSRRKPKLPKAQKIPEIPGAFWPSVRHLIESLEKAQAEALG